ncbi:MAG TPA: hypothetical protein VKK79_22035 [Candidatus Lokiarchaeia archaeon]|nr:hypothetical protein [Candidatus Lokiarchaeia archaeon]
MMFLAGLQRSPELTGKFALGTPPSEASVAPTFYVPGARLHARAAYLRAERGRPGSVNERV